MEEIPSISHLNIFSLKEELERKSLLAFLLSVFWLSLIGFFVMLVVLFIFFSFSISFLAVIILFVYFAWGLILSRENKKEAIKDFLFLLIPNVILGIIAYFYLDSFVNIMYKNFESYFIPFAVGLLMILSLIAAFPNTLVISKIVNKDPTGFVSRILNARNPNLNDEKEKLCYEIFDAIRLGFGIPPHQIELKVVDWPIINALAVSSSSDKHLIIVTRGAIEKLDYHELENVFAHEFVHIKNKDSEYMTRFAVVSGSSILLAWFLAFSFPRFLASVAEDLKKEKKIDAAMYVLAVARFSQVVGLYFFSLTPLLMAALISKASKTRELLADVEAVKKTNYPPGLMSTLVKVAFEETKKFIEENKIPRNLQMLFFDTELDSHPKIWQRLEIISYTTKTPLPPEFSEIKMKNI